MTKMSTGTYEWAAEVVNCVNGCEHDCRYCFARYSAVDRYHRMTADEWRKPVVREADVNRGRKKIDGVVMFPSTHDITPAILEPCMTVLAKLLAAGNEVLLVSKPHLECIEAIAKGFGDYKDTLRFRFTIGSSRDEVLKFWEPGAPSFEERRNSLKLAFDAGFKTSISAEPLLDPFYVRELWEGLIDYVNWEFWIGKLNKSESRVKIDTLEAREKLQKIHMGQTDDNVMLIYERFKDEPLVRWKDSYKKVITKFHPDTLLK